MTVADVMRYSLEDIDNEFIKREPAAIILTKDPNAICNLVDGHLGKEQTIGPILYCTAYIAVKTIFLSHSSSFEDTFDRCLALVGGFDAIEKIKVAGEDKFCGKTMVVRVCVEKNKGVADGLRMGCG
jgi:hypothetical protein